MAGHLKEAQHRLLVNEASRIKHEVERASVCQEIADFEPIQALDDFIPKLKVYHDAWSCTVDPRCYYTALKINSLKYYCAREHRDQRSRSRYRVQNTRNDSWARVDCQQMFPSQHGSNYFRVRLLRSAADNSTPVDAVAETKQRVRDAQRALEQRTIREIEDRQQGTEFNSWLEKMGWPTYLKDQDRGEIIRLVETLNANKEPLIDNV